jgi:5-methylcytosine-specific restriction endonuclease McrA
MTRKNSFHGRALIGRAMTRKPLSKQLRVQVLARDKYRCLMCGRGKDEVTLEVDHVIPAAETVIEESRPIASRIIET